jgi:hypothetical protein
MLTARGWQLAVVFGAPFAILMAALGWFGGAGLGVSVISGACVGLLVGGTVALASRGPRREHQELLSRVSAAESKVVQRAAWTGTVPEDPRLRDEALALAGRQLARMRRSRIPLTVLFGLNVVLQVVSAFNGNWWSILSAVFLLCAVVMPWHSVRRLERRIALLEA